MSRRRRSDRFFVVLAVLALLAGATLGDALLRGPAGQGAGGAGSIAGQWGLTDLALATAARYTRHPAVADRHAAFQDHPGALDHFPSGAGVPPPPHLRAP